MSQTITGTSLVQFADIPIPKELKGASDEFIAHFKTIVSYPLEKVKKGETFYDVPRRNSKGILHTIKDFTTADRGLMLIVSPFYRDQWSSPRFCTKLNHPLALGCTECVENKCQYQSRCVVCGEHGHGAYSRKEMYSKDSDYICPIQNMISTNLKRLGVSFHRFYELVVMTHEFVNLPL